MNGQNPNNQLNQNDQNNLGNVNPNVLGNVTPGVQSTNQNASMAIPNNSMPQQSMTNFNAQSEPLRNDVLAGSAPNNMINGINDMPNVAQKVQMDATNNVSQPQTNNFANQNINTTQNLGQNVVNNGPVAQPIPGTEGTYQATSLTGNTVGTGTASLGQENINTNGYVEPNRVENIGSVPPSNQTPVKQKKPMNKTLFVVLIIVLIAAVAIGVYYFLNMSNSVNVSIKDVNIGVGETLSDNISDYATITGKNADTCTLNNRNVDTSTIGEYEFEINCGDDKYTGKVIVSDMTAPVATTNVVYKVVNDTINSDEFVSSCEDPSGCDYTFADEAIVNGYLQTAGGPYTVGMNVTDEAGNTTTLDAYLYVSAYDILAYTSCILDNQTVSGYQANKAITDFFPIGRDASNELSYLGIGRRIYTYVFTNIEEYNTVKGEKPNTLTFDNVTGLASYDDENLTITISTDLSNATLNTEAGGTFGPSYAIFRQYYTDKGYTCSNSTTP